MSAITESRDYWRSLHKEPRFRPQYPNEDFVRFVMANFPAGRRSGLRALDVGVGAGRHTKFLCELGFTAIGTDLSDEGLRHCADWTASLGFEPGLAQADMVSLPFANNSFDCAVSFGVYYYTDRKGMARALTELHRVLRQGGRAFVVLRTTSDYRFGKGASLGENTFRIETADTNEFGTVQHFLTEDDVPEMFGTFSSTVFEKAEFTFNGRAAVNSDWLITVVK